MTQITPQQFVAKWKQTELRERAACQEHFIDLCRLLDHLTPAEADPGGQGRAKSWQHRGLIRRMG